MRRCPSRKSPQNRRPTNLDQILSEVEECRKWSVIQEDYEWDTFAKFHEFRWKGQGSLPTEAKAWYERIAERESDLLAIQQRRSERNRAKRQEAEARAEQEHLAELM